jgi:hypothetical protein
LLINLGEPQRHKDTKNRNYLCALCVFVVISLLPACRQQMADQPYYRPLEPSDFFKDRRSARQLVNGTVAHGYLRNDPLLYTGKSDNPAENRPDPPQDEPRPGAQQGSPSIQEVIGHTVHADIFPFPVTRQVVEQGRLRFNIFCAPCHDRMGTGQGMIVRRGYAKPPSLHIERLRQAPVGHFFDVMTNGFGAMPNYSDRVSAEDRWAITAYIRALQLSRQASLNDLPAEERQKLEQGGGQ